ncbi:hypothetical protein PF002_g23901 [Phytophthora fragariae]|nr:hypothetical protein PF002_g23901 [Phytophthora fragariae]
MEGVHCDKHDCTIENVWWDDVCEDALSVKGGTASSVTTVTNCGARSASDKVVQHNGHGTVKINGFFAQEFGKLYRSCGTCGNIARTVTVENVYAIDPLVSLVTVNKNYGDKATLSNIRIKTSNGNSDVKVCQWSQGSKTPSNLGDGPSGKLCQYSESDIHINQK